MARRSDRPIARPLIGAHRGDSAHWPENTLAAFRGAIAAGADFIETDLRLTRDGVPIAFHDADFARLGGDARQVADATLAEARALHPSLATIAEAVGAVLPHALLLLDVKLTAPDELIAMAEHLERLAAGGRIALGLRGPEAVDTLHGRLRGWPRLGLFADPADYARLAAQGGAWARLWQADASPARIAEIRALGLNVVVMTGNPITQTVGAIDPAALAALVARAPQAVMLNDPGLAAAAIGAAILVPSSYQEP